MHRRGSPHSRHSPSAKSLNITNFIILMNTQTQTQTIVIASAISYDRFRAAGGIWRHGLCIKPTNGTKELCFDPKDISEIYATEDVKEIRQSSALYVSRAKFYVVLCKPKEDAKEDVGGVTSLPSGLYRVERIIAGETCPKCGRRLIDDADGWYCPIHGFVNPVVKTVWEPHPCSPPPMEKKEKDVEDIRQRFKDLPVDVRQDGDVIVIRLSRYVDRDVFDKYIRTAKELGARFDKERKAWVLP